MSNTAADATDAEAASPMAKAAGTIFETNFMLSPLLLPCKWGKLSMLQFSLLNKA